MKRYEVTFRVKAPFISRGTRMASFGVDLPMARNESGKPVLHGSHVWGKIRESLVTLQAACDQVGKDTGWNLPRWLGGLRYGELGDADDAGDETKGLGQRRLIHCSDFSVETAEIGFAEPRVRIAIDPVLGAAEKGALQVIEEPWATGTELELRGRIGFMMPEDEARVASRAIRKALLWTQQFGALGSVGFGTRTGDVEMAEIRPPSSVGGTIAWGTSKSISPDRVGIVLDFSGEPFFVSERRDTPNSFVGSEVIPGGVFIGALANLMNFEVGDPAGRLSKHAKIAFPHVAKAIDHITVTHFKPVEAESDERPKAIELASFGDGNAFCMPPSRHEIEAFAPDRKGDDETRMRANHGWPKVKRELRLRTGISPDTRAAKTSSLFGLQMCQTSGLFWKAEIDLSDVPAADRVSFLGELETVLLAGLPGIGRGKAFARVEFLPPKSKSSANAPLSGQRWVVVLETPAVIREPDKTYQEAFEQMSDGAFLVEEVFVRERLAGAEFLGHRSDADYSPVLMTEAGSTFLISARDIAKVTSELRGWLQTGIPPQAGPNSLREVFSNRNGYGEIRVRAP